MDTERNAEFLEEIKKHLNPDRLYHSLNVADEAKKLALHYGADEKKAFTAGLLHDIMKNTAPADLLKFFEDNGIMLTKTEQISPKINVAVNILIKNDRFRVKLKNDDLNTIKNDISSLKNEA